MKILITGRSGQLARSLLERGRDSGHQLIALGRPELDLEQPGSAAAAVRLHRPEVIVSAAAYTAVDRAEDEPERAYRVNGAAPGEFAEAANEVGARVIQISTDYVFDGRKQSPYREADPVCPLNVYGRSKLLGEERVRKAAADHVIVRTSWLYSPWGSNFVRTMMNLAQSRSEIDVVSDQYGCPTSALDLADGVLRMASDWSQGKRSGLGEVFNFAGAGTTSWCGFASFVFQQFGEKGGTATVARPISAADYPTRARRPAYSALDCAKWGRTFYELQDWRVSAKHVVERLLGADSRATPDS